MKSWIAKAENEQIEELQRVAEAAGAILSEDQPIPLGDEMAVMFQGSDKVIEAIRDKGFLVYPDPDPGLA